VSALNGSAVMFRRYRGGNALKIESPLSGAVFLAQLQVLLQPALDFTLRFLIQKLAFR
jgi:hypothetical protein